MKYKLSSKALFFSIIILSIFSSCEKSLTGSGEIQTIEYETLGFNFIEYNTVGNVNIIQGDEQSVTLTTNENLHHKMRIQSINNILILEVEDGFTIEQYDILQFDIVIPEVSGAELNGSGDILFPDSISGESFRCDLDGSGNITAENINCELVVTSLDGSGNIEFNKLLTKNLHIAIDGSGDISMSGKTDIQNINIGGSGDISNFNVPSITTNITISGSGNCEVNASEFLNADISGSGNIYYKGSAIVDSNISGSGKLINTP